MPGTLQPKLFKIWKEGVHIWTVASHLERNGHRREVVIGTGRVVHRIVVGHQDKMRFGLRFTQDVPPDYLVTVFADQFRREILKQHFPTHFPELVGEVVLRGFPG